ncbi:hypothetical protein [Vitiosangium sp. GDMCC 1.1324]|uniref:hypothetical protein n=1 Tax=Vitiosangium sp. (strain GDMCC 1.1324) TaxID=2138576 RepID=UPI000D369E28|nr:hypothetical protein [Vitiosangium sp. GDMCC 1.1324]PTL82586.1 hypothetical protein DAT35_17460 [Vitiosangium sp. GDMCC 1.1324]
MALVIRYRCHACGAHVDSTGHAAWVRCGYCRALVGIDWQAWFESPAYAEWLRSYTALQPKFTALQQHRTQAEAAVRAGRLDEAERHLREVVTLQMEVTPQLFPPEVRTDAAYRERYIRYEAWSRLQTLEDPTLAALDAQMQAVSVSMDLKDPIPTAEKVLDIVRQHYDRLFTLPGFEDPDGMPPASRCRLSLTLIANAYLPLLSPEQRLTLLRSVHGANNVLETGKTASDEVGVYLEWTCPTCGLVSFQGRTATELTCVGCFYKRPFSADVLGLDEVSTRCGSCGHPVTLPEGTLELPCDVCGAQVRRIARTGAVEQTFSRDMAARYGTGLPVLPDEGAPGLPVTESNRWELRLAGLARQASWYAKIVPLSRYVRLVRQSFPELTDAERAAMLERVGELKTFEGLSEDGRVRLAEARAKLLGA